ncbi:DUF6397 family protein [Streptomyces sp. ME19-01-6]|uniref:DUF6397 family protein n=1 Tax=Streptomyces sp. ME19-01-6 TaxID=3028686 RepID=UPI0029B3F26D|nr:DUF6397 family protein [Streptomyces sp. ME19-01-6]MDX3227717.1 DUF6397 family protein [Streptomyces sp. ME19-01-6]
MGERQKQRKNPVPPVSDGAAETVALDRAARELGLRRGEFELAVQLGEVCTVAVGSMDRRVARAELLRLAAAEGFPSALRARLRVVGTAEGAELLGISQGRFTRLARGGFFTPVRFYVNRYRAVVWLYPAAELGAFAEREPALLTGRIPAGLRATLDAGEDQRAARWRGRRVEQLLARTDDPWERAAVWAAVLAPAELDAVVTDPAERAYVRELMPRLAPVPAGTGPAAEVTAVVVTADDPAEIRRCRAALDSCVRDARRARPIPPPVPRQAEVAQSPESEPAPPPARPRRLPLWHRLVRGRRSAAGGLTAPYTGRKSPSCTTETRSRPARS